MDGIENKSIQRASRLVERDGEKGDSLQSLPGRAVLHGRITQASEISFGDD